MTKSLALFSSDGPLVAARFQRTDSTRCSFVATKKSGVGVFELWVRVFELWVRVFNLHMLSTRWNLVATGKESRALASCGCEFLNCGCEFSTCTSLRHDEILSPQDDTMPFCGHEETRWNNALGRKSLFERGPAHIKCHTGPSRGWEGTGGLGAGESLPYNPDRCPPRVRASLCRSPFSCQCLTEDG